VANSGPLNSSCSAVSTRPESNSRLIITRQSVTSSRSVVRGRLRVNSGISAANGRPAVCRTAAHRSAVSRGAVVVSSAVSRRRSQSVSSVVVSPAISRRRSSSVSSVVNSSAVDRRRSQSTSSVASRSESQSIGETNKPTNQPFCQPRHRPTTRDMDRATTRRQRSTADRPTTRISPSDRSARNLTALTGTIRQHSDEHNSVRGRHRAIPTLLTEV